MKKLNEALDRLLEIAGSVKEDIPEAVSGAINDLADEAADAKKLGIKAFFYKNGVFSKTATFATVANLMVLGLYPLQSLFAGTVFEILGTSWTMNGFDAAAAAAILAIVDGAYIGNNAVKMKADGQRQ